MLNVTRLALLALTLLLPVASQSAEPTNPAKDWCTSISGRLGSVQPDTCLKLQFKAAPDVSLKRNALMFRDLPPPPQKMASARAKPTRPLRILLIGGIHGDELTSASIVFRWLQWLDENEARQYHWRVIPLANPDGLLANPPQRTNAGGVDINRNFPTPDWTRDAHAYWTSKTQRDPRRYPGKVAMSEPETRWLHGQIESFKPDLVVSIHAPYGILDYDGPARQPRRFGSLSLNRLGIYPGSLGNFGSVQKQMSVVTIELPHATVMPPAREQRKIWDDMLTWIQRNLVGKNRS